MRGSRWLGLGLMLLGVAVAVNAVLGPFVFEVIRYRTSDTMVNQVVGGDAAALIVVAPVCIVAGLLALRGHPSAPVLALGPAFYALYTFTQLVVGQEYLRLPGNNERYFPLHLGAFILAGAIAIAAWSAVDPAELPAPSRRTSRLVASVLAAIVVFLVLALHLPSMVDALRDTPTRVEYVTSPTPFWLVKLMDLGIIVPVAVAAAIGLLRGDRRARKPMYAVVGAYTLVGASVAGMAITMLANDDPDASAANAVAFTGFALAFAALAVHLYRPLFTSRAAGRATDLVHADPG